MKTTVKRNELVEIISRIAEKIKSERGRMDQLNAEKRGNYINRPIIIRNFLNEVIDRIQVSEQEIQEKLNELQLDLKVPNLYILLFSIDCRRTLKLEMDPRHYELLTFGITNIAQELLRRHSNA